MLCKTSLSNNKQIIVNNTGIHVTLYILVHVPMNQTIHVQ